MDLCLGGEVETGERSDLHSGSCVDGVYGCSKCHNAANGGKGQIGNCEICDAVGINTLIVKAWDEPVLYEMCHSCTTKDDEDWFDDLVISKGPESAQQAKRSSHPHERGSMKKTKFDIELTGWKGQSDDDPRWVRMAAVFTPDQKMHLDDDQIDELRKKLELEMVPIFNRLIGISNTDKSSPEG